MSAWLLLPLCLPGLGQKQAVPVRQQAACHDWRPEERVDINRATVNQMLGLPGLTQVWAARIVRYRPYQSRHDLVRDGVLPDGVYTQVKECLVAHHAGPGGGEAMPAEP